MNPIRSRIHVVFAALLASIAPPPRALAGDPPRPPVAERIPHPTTLHGETRADDYYWLRDKKNARVISYLEAENAYADSMTAANQSLRDSLYQEMLARIKQTDLTVPYRRGDFLYYTRTEEGKQYPYYCRRRGTMESPEEVLLDVNALAVGHRFMSIGDFEVSPDSRRLAYTIDSTGYRQYILAVKDLETGHNLPDHAERVTSIAWATDGRTLFYTQEDDVSKRSYRLYRHSLETAAGDRKEPQADELLYEEKDEHFEVEVELSRSREWLIQTRGSHTTSEVAVLPAASPRAPWKVIAPRVHEREYYVDHRGDRFWIRVNDKGKNYRLVIAPVSDPAPSHWTEILPHDPKVMISGVTCFKGAVVVSEREGGLPQIVMMNPETHATRRVHFDEAAYTVGPAANAEFDTGAFRYGYQSFLTPVSVFDLDLGSLDSKLLKRTEVLGGWDPSRYAMERLWATAKDGAKIPITILYRKGLPRDGSAPCLLHGYGSYGIPQNVTFSSNRFSLVDRGMVFAMAHIRGGGEFGETWHEAARMATKMNTFTDFIACAEELVASKVARKDGIVIQGGSAGGLLMGAVTNLRPDLFKGVFTQVPFVDVLNTMLDESLPLTVGEFEEWGNPKVAQQYRWMRAYSPYDNVRAAQYPSMLVRTSLNDSQVSYWEPAKYVARLRAMKTDSNPLLFKCNMGAGHGGASGRYDALEDTAFDYVWILGTVRLAGTGPRP
ncbi:MAG TPA: S9 family peptidase [Candidatus Eisenbacteria bacterium]|jgi:oligopeptidase B